LPGFNYKEFRGRLAITANFFNYYSDEEASVQEHSGIASIFDQKFFLDLRHETKIDLENIVYYKDDMHYFVMTAKLKSLIKKGVIEQNISAAKLLSKKNVNFEALCDFAKLAAYVSTNRKFKILVFASNHNGKQDVAIFDFESLFHSANASRIFERKGKKIFLSCW
jgi:F-actin monooxygenase